MTEVDGIVPEYAEAARRYLGSERAAAYLAQIDQPGTKMARIAVRPTWAGILDFQTRFPDGVRQSSGIRLFRRGRGTAGTSISGGNRVRTMSLGVLRFDETALLLNVSMQRGEIAVLRQEKRSGLAKAPIRTGRHHEKGARVRIDLHQRLLH